MEMRAEAAAVVTKHLVAQGTRSAREIRRACERLFVFASPNLEL